MPPPSDLRAARLSPEPDTAYSNHGRKNPPYPLTHKPTETAQRWPLHRPAMEPAVGPGPHPTVGTGERR
jgi:hypothetical protein